MNTPLSSGEVLYKDGISSIYRGIETVGGWLYLTNQWLIFESHAFNVQTGVTAIPLPRIQSVVPAHSLVFGIPILPNAIHVTTHDGGQFRILVHRRDEWAAAILQLKANAASPPLDAEVL